jgi:AcrR family transcriptional regulator
MSVQAKPKQARSLKKRDALIRAGEAEFTDCCYAGATSKSIAVRAGVATGSFYQHFANKDELLHEIARQRMTILQENLKALKAIDVATLSTAQSLDKLSVKMVLKTSLAFIFDFHVQNPTLHQVLEQRRHLDTELDAILSDGEKVLEQRVLQFVKSFNVLNPEVVASNLFAMAEGVVHRHVFAVKTFKAEDVIEQAANMLAAYFIQHTTHHPG